MKISMHAFAVVAVALSTYTAIGQTVPAKAPVPAAKTGPAPRTAEGQPDLSGFWSMAALRYGGNLAMGKESEVPYTDQGRQAFKDHDAKDDPTGLCLPPGMPRMLHSPFPMMVMQDKNHVAFLYEYMRIWRLIDLNRT